MESRTNTPIMTSQRAASLAWIAALVVASGIVVSDGVTAFSSCCLSWHQHHHRGARPSPPSYDTTISRRSSRAALVLFSPLKLSRSSEEPQPPHEELLSPRRRQWIAQTFVASATGPFVALLTAGTPAPALAKQEEVEIDPVAVQRAFDAVRKEVLSDSGGVAFLQKAVEAQDFPALLEFTKTYDQVLRKGAMGRAKKMMATKEAKEAATAAANGVTFDLIGINRSARPGQENAENAAKYLQELRDDVQKFLDLEPKL